VAEAGRAIAGLAEIANARDAVEVGVPCPQHGVEAALQVDRKLAGDKGKTDVEIDHSALLHQRRRLDQSFTDVEAPA
jgi:hypothetical protein